MRDDDTLFLSQEGKGNRKIPSRFNCLQSYCADDSLASILIVLNYLTFLKNIYSL